MSDIGVDMIGTAEISNRVSLHLSSTVILAILRIEPARSVHVKTDT